MHIEIVEAYPSLEEYKTLRFSTGWEMFNDASLTKAIKSSFYYVLAKAGNKTVGMGRITGDGGII